MLSFSPEMVVLAREAKGLTQKELGREVGASQAWISKTENGLQEVEESTLTKMAHALEVTVEFLRRRDPGVGLPVSAFPELDQGSNLLAYRKKRGAPKKAVRQFAGQIEVWRYGICSLVARIDAAPPVAVPTFDASATTPEDAARAARARWRIPSGPVESVMETLENAGVIVVPTDVGTTSIDAISLWTAAGRPMIFFNDRMPGDRVRFNLAHEAGHLCLHQVASETMEEEANRFAAEFLMPADDIKEELKDLSMFSLSRLKTKWKVSMAALLFRAGNKGLSTISADSATELWIEMSRRGYRKREPHTIEQERPALICTILGQAIETLGERSLVADAMGITLDRFEREYGPLLPA